ncbi:MULTISPECIES: hypothetical protein [Staphylococcus]|uniref:hypothetical protein n=1 Tax=Staphylococcus TaxID=1279 RepID=UPI000D1B64F6|nr:MULTISPECIES: hypothetical protein [Staphylococcus]MBO1222784.1 hypothetical protein [Staphylococcus nepalensis]PUZ31000.1 hypothetical protein BU606_12560 [Staphylococcus arlettae]
MDYKKLFDFKNNILFLLIALVIGVIAIFAFYKTTNSVFWGVFVGILFFISSYIYWVSRDQKKKR